MKDHRAELGAAMAEIIESEKSPSLTKRAGAVAKFQSVLKTAMGEISARLDVLEKAAAAEQAARFGFGAADGDQARISQLEAELAVLKARHEPAAHVEGLAKTLGRGAVLPPSENHQGQRFDAAGYPLRH